MSLVNAVAVLCWMLLVVMVGVAVAQEKFDYHWPEIGNTKFDIRVSNPVKKSEVPPHPSRRIIYVTAEWCLPCKQHQTPEIDKMIKAKWRIGSKIKMINDHIWQYDFDKDAEIVRKYDIDQVPTFVLVDSKGKELHREVGTRTSFQLSELYSRK